MASNVYEGMFILDSNRYGRDPEGLSGQISQIIEKAGGEMLVSRLWEERRLAYSIKGQRKGTYWLTYFRLEGGQLADIQRQFRISEGILREMFVRQDPRIVDTLVAHALAGKPGTGSRRRAGEEEAKQAGAPLKEKDEKKTSPAEQEDVKTPDSTGE